MYKEFRFLPTIQFSLMIKRLKEVIRNKKKALFYIGGSDVLPPPLARDEETKLLKEYAGGSQEARSILIERNLRLVVYISKKFENAGVNVEDLISIGTIGLIKAVNTFKLEKNIKSTVSVNIENHFLHYKQIPFFVYDDFGRKSQTHK